MQTRVQRRARRLFLFAAALLLASAPEAVGQVAAPSSSRAFLVRGTFAVRGLPFFSPNAIPGLKGEYAIGAPPGERRVPVWYTREPLVLGPAWRRTSLAAYTAYMLPRGSGGPPSGKEPPGPVLALVTDRYALLLELPADTGELRDFAVALERRFAVFFENARTDAELSFPAFVDLHNNS